MNACRTVGRAESLYFAVAITVTIIELAVIATTPTLGTLALEYALIAQLAISVLVEFGAAYILVIRLGIIRATQAGFTLKALSCCLFFSGVIVAAYSFFIGWMLILSSFLVDAIGTGMLKAAFRPAYSAMHCVRSGKPADYVNSLRGFGAIRLGLPCVLLFLVGVAKVYADDIRIICAMFLIVLGCRGVQILLARLDLRGVKLTPDRTSDKPRLGSAPVLTALKKAPELWACYILGTVFESVILMYGIGLIYKYKEVSLLPDPVSWMGASAVSLGLYLFSYAGAGCVVRYWSFLKGNNLFLAACSCLTGVVVFLLLQHPGEAGYLAGLVGFCFSASVSAILLVRFASTQCLLLFNEEDSARIFLWAELAANAGLIVIVVMAATLMGPDSIMRIFGILLAVSTTAVSILCVKRPWEYSERTK